MKVRYTVFDPTGNITVLSDTPADPADQPRIAARLMELEPEAEQVGFLSEDRDGTYLRMAGGEFCGNASMSAAVITAKRHGLSGGTVTLNVSGAADPVRVRVDRLPGGSWRGTVSMPRPFGTERIDLPGAGLCPVVRFDGISHVILEKEIGREEAERLARTWCVRLGADALGLMFLDCEKGCLTPLVYVPAADTLCWEKSCASGTTAVGAYLSEKKGRPFAAAFDQPGGSLTVEAAGDGALFLTGTVRILNRGIADMEF